MSEPRSDKGEQRLVEGYRRMLERVRLAGEMTPVPKAIEAAREKASELGELTREEAERVADYLRRDLQDAAGFLDDAERDLAGWLSFDAELIERTLAEMFLQVADRTRVELAELALTANAVGEWHSGEVAGIGTLQCKSCGELLHFRQPAHIPPCPKCHGSTYRRVSTE